MAPEQYVAPTMIAILVVMCLMFIILCVVLRLFSRERWRENRTIFNTPNPRLMNVSLLRDSKHGDRRGSKASAKGPSRHASMGSLRLNSPSLQGLRRNSKTGSNMSLKSTTKSPVDVTANPITTPTLEKVTVEIRNAKA
ncbi:uncharacterized protein LOC108741702 [Agrilus planipennis]|uniref:Uncharacterized protein LOC108741702 n=1 Tax=Agrilus planipennis TaxID=224129 RepID=A0A1W4XI93_AGRPL|nr:uncharacterized protein LOC108741702 [Agrilus planipennis]